jgi:hypothetical protein
MKLYKLLVMLGVIALAVGMAPHESAAGSPVSFGISIGIPAPVAIYPAPAYYPPAYVYYPPVVYGPQVVVSVGPRYGHYGPPRYYGHYYGHRYYGRQRHK